MTTEETKTTDKYLLQGDQFTAVKAAADEFNALREKHQQERKEISARQEAEQEAANTKLWNTVADVTGEERCRPVEGKTEQWHLDAEHDDVGVIVLEKEEGDDNPLAALLAGMKKAA